MRQTPTPGCRHSTNIRLALGTFRRWLRPIADFFPPRTRARPRPGESRRWRCRRVGVRSEEHTSELQSLRHLVCRLLLEKKKNKTADSKDNRKNHEIQDDTADTV